MTYLARLVGRARGDADGGLRPRHRSRYETPPARDSELFAQTVRPALDRAPEARSTGRSEGEPSLAVTEPATVHVADPAPAPTRPAAAPSARPIGPERFRRVEAVAEPAEAEPPATRAPAVTFAPSDDAGRARLARPAVAAAAPTGPVPEGIRDRTAPAEVAGDVAPTAAEPAGWPPLGRRQIAPSGQVIPALAVFDDDGHAPVVSERPPRPAFLHAGRRGDDRARPEPSRHAPGPPVIEVTIGRVEVRAVPESRKAEPAGRAAPPLALADYLAEQRRGRVNGAMA